MAQKARRGFGCLTLLSRSGGSAQYALVAPEILKSRWRELGVANGMLDVPATKVILD